MKMLVVGGAAQGKLEYVKHRYAPQHMVDGGLCPLEDAFSGDALNHFHLLVRRLMEENLDPVDFVERALVPLENWIILCDEVGGGVVPIDAFERQWREQVGGICCILAQQADQVERLCCGIAQRLK